MSTGYTYDFANKLLDSMLRGENFPTPDRVKVGLFTSDPGFHGNLDYELDDSNYERKDFAHSGNPVNTGFDTPEEGVTRNSRVVEFNPLSSNSDGSTKEVTITHFGIFLQVGSDEYVLALVAPLNSPRTLETGDVLTWDQASVVVDLMQS